MMGNLLRRLQYWISNRNEAAELAEEIEFHRSLKQQGLEDRGMSEEEAAFESRRALGNAAIAREDARGIWIWPAVDRLRQDVSYGIRILRRSPGVTTVVVLTLAIGIGASTVGFNLLNGIFLRPLPMDQPERLMTLMVSTDGGLNNSFSYPDYIDVRDRSPDIFSGLAAYGTASVAMRIDRVAERMRGEIVTGNYFEVLGLRPTVGRFFLPEDDQVSGAEAVIVLSHQLWVDRFGSDPGIAGRSVTVNSIPFTVIGVAPAGFNSASMERTSQFWVPSMMQPEIRPASARFRQMTGSRDLLNQRANGWIRLVARLGDGVGFDRAQSGLEVISPRIAEASPQMRAESMLTLVQLGDEPGLRDEAAPIVAVIVGVVTLVLIIAGANVANLLLSQGASRRREISVRLALGAGRARLVRQLLTESILVALMGGVGGLLLTTWSIDLFHALGIPSSIDLRPDVRVIVFTAAVSILSAIVVGVIPAWFASQVGIAGALHDESTATLGGRKKGRVRNVLVIAQLSLSVILLVGSGLFLRTLYLMAGSDPGFDRDKVVLASTSLDLGGYNEDTGLDFYGRLLERTRNLPGVESASLARIVPLSGSYSRASSFPANRPPEPGNFGTQLYTNTVWTDYFSTMGIALLAGRDFRQTDRKNSSPVAVVNETLADSYWPGEDPIGKVIASQAGTHQAEVIGIVANTLHRDIRTGPIPVVYYSAPQQYSSTLTLHVRASGEPGELGPFLRAQFADLDSSLPLLSLDTLDNRTQESVSAERLSTTLIALCGAVSLLLAAIGLYAVIAFSVTERTKEIGVRRALGAQSEDILNSVIGRGMWLVAAGLGLGLAGSLAATRSLSSLLFGVGPADPLTLGAVCFILAVVGLSACYAPARRAMVVDPMTALRNE